MSQKQNDIFCPITAAPFQRSKSYLELPPCNALKPFIRCFWGTSVPIYPEMKRPESSTLIIPDVCMDIIFEFDAENRLIRSGFCSLDERPHFSNVMDCIHPYSTFAIRFYAWTAGIFTGESMRGRKNQTLDVDEFFPTIRKELVPLLMTETSLERRARLANAYFFRKLDQGSMNCNLMNSVAEIVCTRGTVRMSDLSKRIALSARQMERAFDEAMGISPKGFASLVRYQLLWQDMCYSPRVDVQDLVFKYGYFDQAHLLNDFKKHHGMTPEQAAAYARRECRFFPRQASEGKL